MSETVVCHQGDVGRPGMDGEHATPRAVDEGPGARRGKGDGRPVAPADDNVVHIPALGAIAGGVDAVESKAELECGSSEGRQAHRVGNPLAAGVVRQATQGVLAGNGGVRNAVVGRNSDDGRVVERGGFNVHEVVERQCERPCSCRQGDGWGDNGAAVEHQVVKVAAAGEPFILAIVEAVTGTVTRLPGASGAQMPQPVAAAEIVVNDEALQAALEVHTEVIRPSSHEGGYRDRSREVGDGAAHDVLGCEGNWEGHIDLLRGGNRAPGEMMQHSHSGDKRH